MDELKCHLKTIEKTVLFVWICYMIMTAVYLYRYQQLKTEVLLQKTRLEEVYRDQTLILDAVRLQIECLEGDH